MNDTKTKWILIPVIIIALIIAVRLLLPIFLVYYANKKIDENPDYKGKIGGVSLSILAGNYSITNITIYEVDSQLEKPNLEVDEIGVSINYSSLFNGKITGGVEIINPVINIVGDPTREQVEKQEKEGKEEKEEKDLAETINEFMPIRLNKLKITNGKIHYMDYSTDPNVDIQAYNINIEANNLTTLPTPDTLLPSKVTGFANTTGQGRLFLNMKLDPLNEVPTFDLNLELKDLHLNELNDFIQAYANFDVEKGTFSLHTEIAARDGHFKGYVKPLIHNLKVAPFEAEEKGVLQKLYEAGVAIVTDILESPGPDKEQLGTRIPLEGKFEDPNIKVWTAVVYLIRNAFVQALVPSIDHSINIGEVNEVKEEQKEK